MTINFSAPVEDSELKPRISVVGVGGAGGNAVNNMIRSNLEGVEFIVTNTDAQALQQSLADNTIQLGTEVTRGLGAGSRPEVGQAAAEEDIEAIMETFEGSNMVFITAGMGGGTGSGAAPVIARAARERGVLTVGVVTKPFHFEGQHRMRTAEAAIEELTQYVDTLIIIPNQNLFRIANEKTTFADAFNMADDVLHSGVRGVTDLIVMPGLINLDFADIRTVMSEMGKAMMGTGEASGEKRALEAAEAAINNPLLEDTTMKGARSVLINITCGMDMTMFEVDEATNRIRQEVDQEAEIIFGATFDEKMEGTMRVSVVATGIAAENTATRRPPLVAVPAGPKAVPAAAPALAETAAQTAHETAPATAGHILTIAESDLATPAPASEIPVSEIPVSPAPASEIPAPAAQAVPPEPKTDGAFIAPPPALPRDTAFNAAGTPAAPLRTAAPATTEAGPRENTEGQAASLFTRMTGITRRKAPGAAAQTAPVAAPVATPVAAPVTATEAAPAGRPQNLAEAGGEAGTRAAGRAEPQQTRLGTLEPSERISPPHQEDDMTVIPAFLRRQAN